MTLRPVILATRFHDAGLGVAQAVKPPTVAREGSKSSSATEQPDDFPNHGVRR